jgi:hypothetical protein
MSNIKRLKRRAPFTVWSLLRPEIVERLRLISPTNRLYKDSGEQDSAEKLFVETVVVNSHLKREMEMNSARQLSIVNILLNHPPTKFGVDMHRP